MKSFEHIYAHSLEDAAALLHRHKESAVVVSGGSDLLAMMKDGMVAPEVVINLQRIPNLRSVTFDAAGGVAIGGMVTLAEIDRNEPIRKGWTAFAEAAASVASPQIRNVATLGGNLAQRSRCWYYRGPFDCWLKGGEECFAVDGENKPHAIFSDGPCHMVHPSDIATALDRKSTRLNSSH